VVAAETERRNRLETDWNIESSAFPLLDGWGYLTPAQIFAPRTSRSVVNRSRLIDRLENASDCALTLLVASAGFGKTTLLASWIKHTQRTVGWLSVSDTETNVSRFASSIAASIQYALGDMLPDFLAGWMTGPRGQDYSAPGLLTSRMIQELHRIPIPFTLVLDDYHYITDEEIHSFVYEVIERLPDNINITLATRRPPALPLSRLRARGLVRDVSGEELRFTREETSKFLKDAMGLSLSNDDISKLDASFEGWIAGLQLAAIGMLDGASVDDLVGSADGPRRHALDYLFEEVLQRQPQDVQNFLLQTSVLDRATAPLCDAVTLGNNATQMLAKLRVENLFVVAIDAANRWYRYHPLFRALLLRQLEQRSVDQLKELRQRASHWFSECGHFPEAVTYAVAARDWNEVARLIEIVGAPLLLMTKEFRDWLRALPTSAIENQPALSIWHGWSRLVGGSVRSCERSIQVAERQFRPGDRLYVQNLLLRSSVAWVVRDGNASVTWARRAIERSDTTPSDRCFAVGLSGHGFGELGKPLLAEEALISSVEDAKSIGPSMMDIAVRFTAILGSVQLQSGRLGAVSATLDETHRIASQYNRDITPSAYVLRAEICLLRNELDQGEAHIQASLDATRRLGNELSTPRIWHATTQLRMARGEVESALSAANEIGAWCRRSGNDGWLRSSETLRARVLLESDRVDEAGDWLRSHASLNPKTIAYQDEDRYLLFVRWNLMNKIAPRDDGMLDQCAALAVRLCDSAKTDSRRIDLANGYIVLAQIYHEMGKRDEALTKVDCAANLLLPEGAIRPFLDYAPGLQRIFSSYGSSAGSFERLPEVRAILDAGPQTAPKQVRASHIFMLSDREHEVLHLIALGMTNDEIAESLTVSPNTVKSHIKNIYFKLDAHSRTQAVSIAREAGFL
jgi:LuxR family transcriptional regulator, maltose regulon positive regulatory protein